MKKITLLVCMITGMLLKAQNTFFSFCIGDPQIPKMNICLVQGYDKEVDENIKWAFDKFWKSSKVLIVDKKATYKINNCYLNVVDEHTMAQGSGGQGNFYSTSITITKQDHANYGSLPLRFPFDNITKDNEVFGADKNVKVISCKALSYAMLYCYVAQNFNKTDKIRKAGEEMYNELRANQEKLKTVTVLVPKELMDNGITEEALKAMKSKYIIETSEQIAVRIKEGKDVKNYGHLLIYKKDKFDSNAFIMDIETGALLGYSSIGANIVTKNLKLQDKDVALLLEQIYKNVK